MLSSDLKPESRILFWRKIGTRQPDSARMVVDRVSHIAPFLEYDPDPYIVIGNDGQLWWIIDIYATSHSYPNAKVYVDDTKLKENPLYSEPILIDLIIFVILQLPSSTLIVEKLVSTLLKPFKNQLQLLIRGLFKNYYSGSLMKIQRDI